MQPQTPAWLQHQQMLLQTLPALVFFLLALA
jgi:hypothetical protein